MVQGLVGGRPFDDVHGAGWRLLTIDDAAEVDADAKAWFASIGGRIVALAEPDPTYERWFAEHDTTWALQRPDFYLYGTAATLADAAALLFDLRRHLANGDLV